MLKSLRACSFLLKSRRNAHNGHWSYPADSLQKRSALPSTHPAETAVEHNSAAVQPRQYFELPPSTFLINRCTFPNLITSIRSAGLWSCSLGKMEILDTLWRYLFQTRLIQTSPQPPIWCSKTQKEYDSKVLLPQSASYNLENSI